MCSEKNSRNLRGIGWDFILILYLYQEFLRERKFIPAKKFYDIFSLNIQYNLEKLTESNILVLKIRKGVSTKAGISKKYYSLNPSKIKEIERYISDNLKYITPFIDRKLTLVLTKFKGEILDEKTIKKIIEKYILKDLKKSTSFLYLKI